MLLNRGVYNNKYRNQSGYSVLAYSCPCKKHLSLSSPLLSFSLSPYLSLPLSLSLSLSLSLFLSPLSLSLSLLFFSAKSSSCLLCLTSQDQFLKFRILYFSFSFCYSFLICCILQRSIYQISSSNAIKCQTACVKNSIQLYYLEHASNP